MHQAKFDLFLKQDKSIIIITIMVSNRIVPVNTAHHDTHMQRCTRKEDNILC